MITANVIHRVFRIAYNGAEGTAFTIKVDGHEYIVTARHVVSALNSSDTVRIFSNGVWVEHLVNLVGHATNDVDISVLAPSILMTPPSLPLDTRYKGLVYGQDVYFLGFPYGFVGKYTFGPDGYPLPIVKKAIVSLFDEKQFLLDGHNNPGFSGGPVVFELPGTNGFNVAGVISAYRYVEEPVYDGHNITTLRYQYNTGIIVAYAIDFAIDLIRANPIGLKID